VVVVVSVDVVVAVDVVVSVDVLVVVVVVVLVAISHGHWSVAGCPVAALRQRRASVAEVGSVPFGAHSQGLSQLAAPTATLRRKRQSVAVTEAPLLTG